MRRLERDRRRAAKRLEARDHAEDLLIVEADRGLVDRGHRRRESRHDEGGGLVHRLDQVVDVAQPRDPGLRAAADARKVGEPERPGLADRVAGQADALALHDLAADLDHVGRVSCLRGCLLGRQHFLLGHHLADIGIERRRREDECADPGNEWNRHDALVPPCSPGVATANSGESGPVAGPWGRVSLSVIGPVVQARDPEDEADQEEEREHGRRHHLRGKAKGGGEGVRRVVTNDAVDMPVLAKPGAHVAHQPHQPGERDRDEDQHVPARSPESCPSAPRRSSARRGTEKDRWR